MMKTTLRLAAFAGPFELLLSLIEEEKLSIGDVALSEVTEQFLAHFDEADEKDPQTIADFLVVAARLLLLKSSMLLPQFGAPEEEGPSLADQLKLYKAFVEAGRIINKFWMSEAESVFRIEPARPPLAFVSPKNASLSTLHAFMLQLIIRLTPPKPLPQTHIDKAISLRDTIDRIREMLGRSRGMNFQALLHDANNKTEVIVSFLALLELVKQKAVVLTQEKGFGDIVIKSVM